MFPIGVGLGKVDDGLTNEAILTETFAPVQPDPQAHAGQLVCHGFVFYLDLKSDVYLFNFCAIDTVFADKYDVCNYKGSNKDDDINNSNNNNNNNNSNSSSSSSSNSSSSSSSLSNNNSNSNSSSSISNSNNNNDINNSNNILQ